MNEKSNRTDGGMVDKHGGGCLCERPIQILRHLFRERGQCTILTENFNGFPEIGARGFKIKRLTI